MRLAIGSDHAGFRLKSQVLDYLKEELHCEVTDFGCYTEEMVDFPDIAKMVCGAVLEGKADRGIMFCGTGVGAAIACNKIPGIRASVCHDLYTAHQCVEHDDVQVIAMGGQIIGHTVAKELIRLFLDAKFSGGEEFRRRVEKLAQMEQSTNK